jgi:tRNA(Ile)-lysidine synthase
MKKTEQKLVKFIDENKLLSQGDRVLIALSGGPDSVFLLHFLVKFQKRFNISFAALHVNHNLRGNDARADEQYCSEICSSLSVKLFVFSEDVSAYSKENKISLEEAGRVLRYKRLQETAAKENFTRIATAHNASDNAETVLLNLIKGTGISGISGIPVTRGIIIRPVLVLTKQEILEYLEENKIQFRIDKSNLSEDYERNFLRHKIIPLIKEKLNPSFEKSILFSSGIFRKYHEKMENLVKQDVNRVSGSDKDKIIIPLEMLKCRIEPELSEFVKLLLERNFQQQIQFKDISGVIKLIDKEPGSRLFLTGGLSAVRERNEIFIYAELKELALNGVKILPENEIQLGNFTFSINTCQNLPEKFPNNGLVEYISADDLDEEFFLRQWKEGDRFRPLGLKGSKKVSDFLNDRKINIIDKKNQFVLTNRGRIVWIPGLRIDERFKIKNSTKKVYKLCLK